MYLLIKYQIIWYLNWSEQGDERIFYGADLIVSCSPYCMRNLIILFFIQAELVVLIFNMAAVSGSFARRPIQHFVFLVVSFKINVQS